MEILWNKINLPRPPYRSWEISVAEFNTRRFIEVIKITLNDFKIFAILNKEAALLSRLIYRMKSKFRHDKGFKYMEKVNRALLNYLTMSFEKEYELLNEYTESNNDKIALPSKQIIQYILVKTQGLAKLMCYIESTALAAGNILKSRIHVGQLWSVALIAYAIISRIWIISRYIVRKLCLWYKNIYNYSNIFKTVGIPWLPDDYVLPENLSNWLNLTWLNDDIEMLSIKKKQKKSIFDLIEVNNSVESSSAIIDNFVIKNSSEEERKSNVCQSAIISHENDLGKPISRISFGKSSCTSASNDCIKKGKTNIINTSKLLNIKTEKDLVRLLKKESFPGFDKLQWNMFQNHLKKFLNRSIKDNKKDTDVPLSKGVIKQILKWINKS